VTPIYHITYLHDWDIAQQTGTYRLSTRGQTLEEVGFIHCSYVFQVLQVANAFYRGERGLVVLVVDPDKLTAPLQVEPPGSDSDSFPHIYGPLNMEAVVEVLPFEPNPDGTFTFPFP